LKIDESQISLKKCIVRKKERENSGKLKPIIDSFCAELSPCPGKPR
jgi:hypothetical protein